MLVNNPVFLQTAPRLLASGLVTGLAGVAASRWVSRRGIDAPSDVRLCATVIVVSTLIVATGIALGAIGVLHDWTWALAVSAVSIALILSRRRAERATTPAIEPWGEITSSTGSRPEEHPSFLFTVAVLGILIGRAVYGLRNPPSDIDSLHYHLPMVGNWIATAGLGLPLREPPAASECYPGNGQLLQLWAAWSTGRETLMPWPGIVAIGVLALALRRLALDLGARPAGAEAGALSLSCAVGVLQLTFGMRIDNMLAAGFAGGLVHALRWRKLGRPFDRDVMLLSLGFVAGLKGTAPAHALLVASVAVSVRGVARRVRALLRPDLPLSVAIVCGGFWVVRNAVAAGNPLYPAQLRVGPWTLPGVLSREFLNGTMQLEVWRQGFAGNLTPPNLWDFYGVGNVVVVVGLIAWAVSAATRGRATPGTATRATPSRSGEAGGGAGSDAPGFVVDAAAAPHMIVLAVVCLGLFLVSPYSGAFWPAVGGRPPRFAMDNVRYLWPGFIAAFPVAALGLSRLPLPRVWAAAIATVSLALLFRMVGHLLPGFALAALLVGATWVLRRFDSSRARLARVVTGALACMALAAAVAWVDPLRERLNDKIWDARHAGGAGLSAASFRAVRRLAHHRSIALVGPVDARWMCYGRDFTGRPTYLPVAIEWQRDPPRFALRHDDRKHADPTRWLTNVDRSSAAAVVIGTMDTCRTLPVEQRWCASDAGRFAPIAQTPCACAYGIRRETRGGDAARSTPARADSVEVTTRR